MRAQVSCPQCGKEVEPQSSTCKYCGVNLALAAVIAERKVRIPIDLPVGMPMKPEILVPRLGEYLIEKGVLSSTQLDQALNYQSERKDSGRPILLGQALVELGYIMPETLDQAITVQILLLQSALRQSNRELDKRVQERTSDLREALEKLTELNQLKANFIATISHELRTPLTHIRGYLDVLADGGLGELLPPQRDALDVISRAELRLEMMIEDLIQFSLASRGGLNIRLAAVETTKLTSTALAQSQNKAKAKGVTIEEKIAENLPLVYCDEEKITWVLNQFVDNGIKFTLAGGKVILAVNQNGHHLTFAVSDTGIGIPPDRLDEIFEPFHQLDGSSTRRYSGTGLGLALSSRIIEAHMSKIEVQSNVGEGTRFAFSLPIRS
jgi:signal transduction histidine kinase